MVYQVWDSNPKVDLGAAYGVTTDLESRPSIFMKGSWLSDARKLTWTIFP
jgi:hypothetical protein